MNLRVLCASLLLVLGFALPARADGAGVLIIGDSNAEGPFGATLYDTLRNTRDPVTAAPLAVSIFAKCGAGANDWFERGANRIDCGAWACDSNQSVRVCKHFREGRIPSLSDLYDKLGATRRVTVVALGLNMIIGRRSSKMWEAEQLIARIRESKSGCIWIGPPQTGDLFVARERYADFIGDLKRTVTRAGCRYIASDDKTDRREIGAKDDHYAPYEAKQWARRVLAELRQPLAELLGARPLAAR